MPSIVRPRHATDTLQEDTTYQVLAEMAGAYLIRLGKKATAWYPKDLFIAAA